MNMLTMLKTMAGMLWGSKPEPIPPPDPTVYQIETTTRKYCGRIIYQDDVVIKLKIAKPKAVKILKTNIDRITVVRNESAMQYYQWHSTRLDGMNPLTN